jgi:Domain of unknown function (DUF3560)
MHRIVAFEHDAYLYLVDQAEGLTDEQRLELGQLAELPGREAFWMLFNESVSPSHQLPDRITYPATAAQPFQGMNNFESERAAKAAPFRELVEKHGHIATGRHFAAREQLENIPLGQPILMGHHSEKRKNAIGETSSASMSISPRRRNITIKPNTFAGERPPPSPT